MNYTFRITVSRSSLLLFSVIALLLSALIMVQLVRATSDVIYGCYKNSNGQLRIVSQGTNCNGNETAINWNQAGQPGPSGAPGPSGNPGNGYFGLPFICPNCSLSRFSAAFKNHDFSYANIYSSFLMNVDISGVSFKGGDVSGAFFGGSNLTGADLSDLNAEDANQGLGGTSAHFEDTNLTNVNFSGSNLTGSQFTNANLQGANFTNANLTGVNFTGAIHMDTANMTGVNWSTAICPDGTGSSSNGDTCDGHMTP